MWPQAARRRHCRAAGHRRHTVTIELALEALTSLEERDKAIAAQWRRRIERARYDVDLAERRYEAVDPANRLIASTLEKRWNDAMQRLLELEAELANFERQTLRTITAEQKRQILQLARRLPSTLDRSNHRSA
jgi:hypothetical protein